MISPLLGGKSRTRFVRDPISKQRRRSVDLSFLVVERGGESFFLGGLYARWVRVSVKEECQVAC